MKKRGVVFTVGLALLVAGSATPALALDVPDVHAPALPPVPTVQAPSLPSVPSAPKVPSVPSVPSVPRPSAPAVPQAPSVPGVTAPAPGGGASGRGTPSAPRGGGGGSGRAGSAAGGGGAGGGSAASGSRARAGGAGGGAGGGGTSRAGGGRSGAAGGRGSASASRAGAPAPRRERRLRAAVRPLEGCLGVLPRLERRVLVLRVGVGDRAPRSRARVARTLDLPASRVARLERRGVRRLRALARTGGCGGSAVPGAVGGGSGPAAAAPPETGVRALALAALGGGPADALLAGPTDGLQKTAKAPDRVEVKGEQQSSAGTAPRKAPGKGSSDDLIPELPSGPAAVRGSGPSPLLPLLGVLALGGGLYTLSRRRRAKGDEPGAEPVE
jgi:hypothetical protein